MALAAWFVRTMRGTNTTIRIDKPVSNLVQDGPFRYSRNPGYLSLTMLYAGIAVLRNALWAILLLPLVLFVIQREVIEREERYLERTFGEEYLDYKRRSVTSRQLPHPALVRVAARAPEDPIEVAIREPSSQAATAHS
jgi:protein-S-isoprenylcysteine O-methyltransferase Ste14